MPRLFSRSERGSSTAELALILPVLIGLLLGALDYARVFYAAQAVTHAASIGAMYGAQSVTLSQDSAGMVNAATTSATDISGFSAVAGRRCACWTASTGIETAMGTCTSTCTSPSVVRIYVTVSTTGLFSTFVNYPGIPHTITINRVARMRAQ